MAQRDGRDAGGPGHTAPRGANSPRASVVPRGKVVRKMRSEPISTLTRRMTKGWSGPRLTLSSPPRSLRPCAPLTRQPLRSRVRMRNERLGEALARLAATGAARRLGDRRAVPDSHFRLSRDARGNGSRNPCSRTRRDERRPARSSPTPPSPHDPSVVPADPPRHRARAGRPPDPLSKRPTCPGARRDVTTGGRDELTRPARSGTGDALPLRFVGTSCSVPSGRQGGVARKPGTSWIRSAWEIATVAHSRA